MKTQYTEVKSKMAEAEAEVTIAERQAVMEKETTATEMTRREAERDFVRKASVPLDGRVPLLHTHSIYAASLYSVVRGVL